MELRSAACANIESGLRELGVSRDIYNGLWQAGESLLRSPRGHTCLPGGEAWAHWSGPLPWPGWRHTDCWETSPFPGLPWDTDQYNPSPSHILAEFPNSLPLPRLRRCCPSSMMLDWLHPGNISLQRDSFWEGFLWSRAAVQPGS